MVTQAERAIQLNRHCLIVSGTLKGVNAKDQIDNDAKGVDMAKRVLQRLRENPDSFHSGMGLLLLTAMDDVSRNAALSAQSLMGEAVMAVATGGPKAENSIERIDSSNTCIESSAFVYSVSETLSSLMVREVKAQNLQSDQEDRALASALKLLNKNSGKQ